ncbi:MAG: DivIVA domain-containing protein [Actinomycetota bacterium]
MDLSSRQIHDQRFSTSRRGYDRGEVDMFLKDCGASVGSLEDRLRTAEVRAAKANKELAALRASIDDLVEDAADTRRRIIEEATVEANRILTQARAEAGSTEQHLRDAEDGVVIDLTDTADEPTQHQAPG